MQLLPHTTPHHCLYIYIYIYIYWQQHGEQNRIESKGRMDVRTTTDRYRQAKRLDKIEMAKINVHTHKHVYNCTGAKERTHTRITYRQ